MEKQFVGLSDSELITTFSFWAARLHEAEEQKSSDLETAKDTWTLLARMILARMEG